MCACSHIPPLVAQLRHGESLTLQASCGNFQDPLIEHPPLLLLLDLILLKPRVYLHLLFNRGHPPKDVSQEMVTSPPNSPDAALNLRLDWTKLALASLAAECAARSIGWWHPHQAIPGHDVQMAIVTVLAELLAQHFVTTVIALAVLRLKGWRSDAKGLGDTDGRRKHFK